MTRRQAWTATAIIAGVALLAGGVFYASLRDQKRRELRGPGPSEGLSGEEAERMLRELEALRELNRKTGQPKAGVDPRVQEALKTVDDINRINRVNQQNRVKTQKPATTAPGAAPSSKPK